MRIARKLLCAVTGPLVAVLLAVRLTYVANVAVIYAMAPFAAASLEWLFLRERMRREVLVTTLDQFVQEQQIARIDLLKIDTQGAELLVLKGAVAVLPRVRMIWAEVSFRALYDGSALFADVHGFLAEQGFRLHSIHAGFRGSDGELLQGDALFLSASVRTGPA